jgi:uncharacterized metal-binding protein
MSEKVVLAPCMGVGKVVANVTRRAAYLTHAACPEDTEILSIPALLAGNEEERRLALEHPVVVIEGCVLRCASHVMKLIGATPAAKVEVSRIIREKRLTPGRTRKELETSGKQLAEAVAERLQLVLAHAPWPTDVASGQMPTGCPFACSVRTMSRPTMSIPPVALTILALPAWHKQRRLKTPILLRLGKLLLPPKV